MRVKLKEIREEMRRRRHQPVPEQGKWLRQVVSGFFEYHAVPTNSRALKRSGTTLPTFGGARSGGAAKKIGRPGNGSRSWPTIFSQNRKSFTLGRMRALPSDTQGGSRVP